MSTINGILNSARSALTAHQKGLSVTGNNIANVNTPGYSRQRVILTSETHGSVSAGVNTADVARMQDRFLEQRLYAEHHQFGRYDAAADGLRQIEAVIGTDASSGLSQLLSQFWDAWEDLSNDPAGTPERIALSATAVQLTERFQHLSSDLTAARQMVENRITGAVGDINRKADQIASLNNDIVTLEAAGGDANGLRDQRGLLLTELSEMIDFHTHENPNGAITVRLGQGLELVQNTSVHRLAIQSSGVPATGNRIVWTGPAGSVVDVTNQISGGRLKGWLDVRDSDIPDTTGRLDSLAGTLISEVNAIHGSGFGLDGGSRPFLIGATAADIGVHGEILVDSGRIAAAGPTDGLPGGNGSAMAISALRYQPVMPGGQSTLNGAAAGMVTSVGTRLQSATDHRETQSLVLEQLDGMRESISGVSLDEEMVQLIQFQRAYEAAAKMIVTADEMLQTLIQMV